MERVTHDTVERADNLGVVVDFHCHHTDIRWPPRALANSADPHQLDLARQICDIEALLNESNELGVDVRVLSAPPSLLTGQSFSLSRSTMREVNDHLAQLIGAHKGSLFGLATIDAFQGEVAAEEAERAVRELGLSGIVIDCANNESLLLDAPEARPTLEAVAALGVPVFAHPISPVPLAGEMAERLGRAGTMLARGTASAASLLALVTKGVFDDVADLRIVFAFLGAAGLVHAAMLDAAEPMWQRSAAERRWHVYVDTMGFDPSGVAYAVSLLGSDHVLVGSYWPLGGRRASRKRVVATLQSAGLSKDQQRDIASRTALGLLGKAASS